MLLYPEHTPFDLQYPWELIPWDPIHSHDQEDEAHMKRPERSDHKPQWIEVSWACGKYIGWNAKISIRGMACRVLGMSEAPLHVMLEGKQENIDQEEMLVREFSWE